jgi:hypothetical protein
MDPIQAFLQNNALTPPAFASTSRYYGIATARLIQADGSTVVYVQRRFLPPPENFAPETASTTWRRATSGIRCSRGGCAMRMSR